MLPITVIPTRISSRYRANRINLLEFEWNRIESRSSSKSTASRSKSRTTLILFLFFISLCTLRNFFDFSTFLPYSASSFYLNVKKFAKFQKRRKRKRNKFQWSLPRQNMEIKGIYAIENLLFSLPPIFRVIGSLLNAFSTHFISSLVETR